VCDWNYCSYFGDEKLESSLGEATLFGYSVGELRIIQHEAHDFSTSVAHGSLP
jgi:hypothetical protein